MCVYTYVFRRCSTEVWARYFSTCYKWTALFFITEIAVCVGEVQEVRAPGFEMFHPNMSHTEFAFKCTISSTSVCVNWDHSSVYAMCVGEVLEGSGSGNINYSAPANSHFAFPIWYQNTHTPSMFVHIPLCNSNSFYILGFLCLCLVCKCMTHTPLEPIQITHILSIDSLCNAYSINLCSQNKLCWLSTHDYSDIFSFCVHSVWERFRGGGVGQVFVQGLYICTYIARMGL